MSALLSGRWRCVLAADMRCALGCRMSLQEIEEEEVKSLMGQAGLAPSYYPDLKALGLGTVVSITSYRGGAFAQSPPHYLTLSGMVDDAINITTLTGVDGWPDDSDRNYTPFMTKLTIFMRLCGRASDAAEERLLRASGVAGTTDEEKALVEKKRREEALKNYPATHLPRLGAEDGGDVLHSAASRV